MDYEKKYNEALNWMRELYPGLHGATKEDAEHYFPELRESEDERIRKELIDQLQYIIPEEGEYDEEGLVLPQYYERINRYRSYLEKQKEQEIRKFKLGDKVHWHDDNMNVVIITGFRDDAYLTDSAYGPILFSDEDNWERVEQKPTDDKAFEEWIDDWWKHNKVNNPDSYDKGDEIQLDERGFKNFCREIRNMYSNQQLAEWSGEDERMRNQLIYDVEYHKKEGLISAKRNKATKTLYNEIERCYDEKIAWLKSLHNRPKPSDSWRPSHNTLPIEQQLEAAIEQQVGAAMIAIRGEKPSKSQQWSEDDEDNLKAIIRIIEDNDSDWKELTDWLKSRLPQPHWKPSEEQIGALNYAYCELFKRKDVGHNILGPLQKLCDELKKQM